MPGASAPNVGAKELSTRSPISTRTEAAGGESRLEWRMLRAASIRARSLSPDQSLRLVVGPLGELVDLSGAENADLEPISTGAELCWEGGRWALTQPGNVSALVDLYLPICSVSPASPLTIGHLGQSLDGNIATAEWRFRLRYGSGQYFTFAPNARTFRRGCRRCGHCARRQSALDYTLVRRRESRACCHRSGAKPAGRFGAIFR